MTYSKSYEAGFRKAASDYGVDPDVLVKVAFWGGLSTAWNGAKNAYTGMKGVWNGTKSLRSVAKPIATGVGNAAKKVIKNPLVIGAALPFAAGYVGAKKGTMAANEEAANQQSADMMPMPMMPYYPQMMQEAPRLFNQRDYIPRWQRPYIQGYYQ